MHGRKKESFRLKPILHTIPDTPDVKSASFKMKRGDLFVEKREKDVMQIVPLSTVFQYHSLRGRSRPVDTGQTEINLSDKIIQRRFALLVCSDGVDIPSFDS